MRPLFTLHAGEYLVGAHIEQRFKRVNVWVPARDTGVDLLASDRANRGTVSLQVKFSKDFLVTHHGPEFQKELRACGWWTIMRNPLIVIASSGIVISDSADRDHAVGAKRR
jgi:hypothetical protein